MPGFRSPDAVVIGAGATGLVVAHELVANGLGVVVLDAGVLRAPGDEDLIERLQPNDGVWRWGPVERSRPPWPRDLDGIAFAPQAAAVGGLDLAGWGARPRGFVGAIETGWPIRYAELLPWFEYVEELLPVRVPEQLAPKDQRFVDACLASRLAHLDGADIDKVGWRLQPLAAGDVTQTLLPRTHATGLLEIREGAFATELLHDEGPDGLRRVRGVRYRSSEGTLVEQDADAVVLTAGAIETPRLVLASALGVPGVTGRGLTCHLLDLVSGVVPGAIDPGFGPATMARCDFPGHGSIFSLGLEPSAFAIASSLGAPEPGASGPWATSGASLGAALKRRLENWSRTLMIGISVDDRSRAGNGIRLHPDLVDEHGAIPRIRYEADDDSVRRREWLARRAGEILEAAGADPETIHRADAPVTLIHAHGTMRMGPTGATDLDGRVHGTLNAYVADPSLFPNAIGGADPALTAQALAARCAHQLIRRANT